MNYKNIEELKDIHKGEDIWLVLAGSSMDYVSSDFFKNKIVIGQNHTYKKYPSTGMVLPAMGYGEEMIKDLEQTINSSNADMVVIGTPIDLNRVLKLNKPAQRVRYELQEIGSPSIAEIIKKKFAK